MVACGEISSAQADVLASQIAQAAVPSTVASTLRGSRVSQPQPVVSDTPGSSLPAASSQSVVSSSTVDNQVLQDLIAQGIISADHVAELMSQPSPKSMQQPLCDDEQTKLAHPEWGSLTDRALAITESVIFSRHLGYCHSIAKDTLV